MSGLQLAVLSGQTLAEASSCDGLTVELDPSQLHASHTRPKRSPGRPQPALFTPLRPDPGTTMSSHVDDTRLPLIPTAGARAPVVGGLPLRWVSPRNTSPSRAELPRIGNAMDPDATFVSLGKSIGYSPVKKVSPRMIPAERQGRRLKDQSLLTKGAPYLH
jgi:hypothetical protein